MSPARAGLRVVLGATRLWLRALRTAADLALATLDAVTDTELRYAVVDENADADTVDEGVGADTVGEVPDAGLLEPYEPPPPREPVSLPETSHVSEQPTLVAVSAERGAADGAGAEVEVAEPWDGYRRETAGEIVAALATATPEELAVVALYERAHRARKTVLREVKRRLAAGG